ncbi:unnamed protein product [Polarella glacialis]|uniref:Uncharacterized protein n=1 Tax=Polarella glacialis TaxID=89957 RepID=A0A813LR15_POLGL|nr:unnamed protein product [Polarella glacialis]
MFNFSNLDDIEADAATPEWLKWQGVPEWQRTPEESIAVLESDREEHFASPPLIEAEREYVYERLDIPPLPDDDAFDPLGLAEDTTDAFEQKIASWSGQVIVNFASNAVEELTLYKKAKEEHQAYIDALHRERLAYLKSTSLSGKLSQGIELEGRQITSKGTPMMNRTAFTWREIHSSLPWEMKRLPNDTVVAESVLTSSQKFVKSLTQVGRGAMLAAGVLVHTLCGLANQVRPMPERRWGRNAEWHLAINDVFFPAAFIVDDGSDIIDGRRAPPTLVHLVAMSVNKEDGGLEATHLLQNIKLPSPASYPSIKRRPWTPLSDK